jgi:hypothetical protein
VRRGATRPIHVGCTLVVAVGFACSGVAAAAGHATATTCAQAVVDDWAKDGLDHTYAAHCYREALAALPEDIRIYSSAPDDIGQALAARVARPAQAVRNVAAVRRTPVSASVADSSAGVPTPALLAGALALVLLTFASAGAFLYSRLHR